jgi:hypothetical protein
MLVPEVLIIACSLVAIFVHPSSPYTIGYLYLTIFNILTYIALLAAVVACYNHENRRVE